MASVIKHSTVWGPKENITLGSGCVPWCLETILKNTCSQCCDSHRICRDPLGSPGEACGCDNASNLPLLTGAEAWHSVKLLLFSLVSLKTLKFKSTHSLIRSWNPNQNLQPLKGMSQAPDNNLLPGEGALNPCSCRFSTKRGLINDTVWCTCSPFCRSAVSIRSQELFELKREATSLQSR